MTDIVTLNQGVLRVGFLLIDGFSMLTYAAATEPLRAANEIAGKRLYEIVNVPAKGARAVAACGGLVPANAHVGERTGYDSVFVVASRDSADAQQHRLLDWLRQLDRRNIPLGGLAAGPLMLARAGLMKGKQMTLHWAFHHMVEEMHPELDVLRQLYVIDEGRFTCAGGTAPVDLMLAIIAREHGHAFSRQVSDWWSHSEERPPVSPQRSGLQSRYQIHNRHVLDVIALMENHLSDPIDLPQLALAAGISERQISRLFKSHTRFRPMDLYKRLRLRKAYELLTQTTINVSDVVAATGFSSHSHFSRSFKAVYHQSPSEARFYAGKPGASSAYAIAAVLPWDNSDCSSERWSNMS